LPTLTDIKKMLLEDIPATSSFGFGKVDNWHYDRSIEYIQKFQSAIQHIAYGLPKVNPPTYTAPQPSGQNKDGIPIFNFHGKVEIQVHAPNDVVGCTGC